MTSVIKAGQSVPLLRKLSTVDLADHLAEADSVLASARRRAKALLEHTEQRAQQLFEESRERGYAEGFAAGRQDGDTEGRKLALSDAKDRFDKEHAQLSSAMRQAADELRGLKTEIEIAAERDVLDLALLIATKLTTSIGAFHRDAALENVKRSLALVGSKTDVTVHVHPDDYDAALTFASESLAEQSETDAVRFVRDESVEPGGCVVRGAQCEIDATLQAQIDQVVALLLTGHPVTPSESTAT